MHKTGLTNQDIADFLKAGAIVIRFAFMIAQSLKAVRN